jgi:hypothetical protein
LGTKVKAGGVRVFRPPPPSPNQIPIRNRNDINTQTEFLWQANYNFIRKETY